MAQVSLYRFSFTATGGAGVYATENWPLGFGPGNTLAGFNANGTFQPRALLGVTVMIDSMGGSNGQVELWLPQPGCQDFTNIANYALYNSTSGVWSAVATGSTIALASYPGALLRCKAGAANGTVTGVVAADG